MSAGEVGCVHKAAFTALSLAGQEAASTDVASDPLPLSTAWGRYKDDADSPTEDGDKPRVLYSLEFTFDADARVAITIYCQASEEFLNGRAV